MLSPSFRSLCVLVLCLTLFPVELPAATPTATIPLPGKATWHRLTDLGLLLVGTPDALLLVNGETGKIQWQRSDIKKTQDYNVRDIAGSSILLVNDWSGAFEAKVSSQGLDLATGETVFRTEPEKGQNLGLFPVPGGGQVLNISQLWLPEAGTFASLYETATGKLVWRARLGKAGAIPPYLAEGSGAFSQRWDLSGYQDPVFTEDTVYLTYNGLMALDLSTGAQRWNVEYRTADKELKRAYAAPVIDGDTIYASGKGAVYAIDRVSGTQRWKSDQVSSGMFSSAAISQVLPAGDAVYVRLGGNFPNVATRTVELKEPLGLMVLEKSTGKKKWEYKKAKDGITNLLLLPQSGVVMVSDAYQLRGFDIAATGKPDPLFEVKLDFKAELGGGEMAAAGVSTLSGLMTGGLSGALKGAMGATNSKARLDVPVVLLGRPDGKVLVAGRQHLLLFDPLGRKTDWTVEYPAPRNSAMGLAMMSALTLASARLNLATQATSSSYLTQQRLQRDGERSFGSLNSYAARRFAATQRSRDYSYVLTEVTEGKLTGPGIRAIRLDNGESVAEVLLDDKEPQYAVDEVDGRLYHLDDDKQVVVYALRQGGAVAGQAPGAVN